MNVLIVGAGAIGCLVSARLAQTGCHVTLLSRPAAAAAMQARDLTLRHAGRAELIPAVSVAHTGPALPPLRVIASLAEAPAMDARFDLIIVAVKAYDTAQVISDLCAWQAELPPVLTLQNGVGNEEMLAQAFGAGRILAGAITTPATIIEPGVIEITRRGRIGLAALTPSQPAFAPLSLAVMFSQAGWPARVYGDYRALKWTKLLMNQLANAACAILGWTPAQLMADARLANLEIEAWRETLAVMAAQDIRPVTLGNYPFPWLAPLIRTFPTTLVRRVLGPFVAGGRGGKPPSLYLDLASGKGRSEASFLNGAVAAANTGVRTPVNTTLAQTMQALCTGETAWIDWRNQPERLLRRVEEMRVR